jgi:hypothetical protein
MKKARSGEAWPTLECSGAIAAPNWSLPTEAPARAYPSSRKQVRRCRRSNAGCCGHHQITAYADASMGNAACLLEPLLHVHCHLCFFRGLKQQQ